MMNDNLQADFIACNDPFLFTVELPALYRSSSSFESTVASLLDLSHDAPPGVRTRLLLGIAYAKRVHSEDEPSALLEHTAALIRTAGSDSELVLIGHTVEAVLTLMRLGDYSRGMVILETVHAELRYGSTLGALYGIVRRWMGLGHMLLSQHKEAETAYQDAVSACRRYEMRFTCAAVLNDYAVLQKRLGRYIEARAMLREVAREFAELGAKRNRLIALSNLGVLALRMGDWKAANSHFCSAEDLLLNDGLSISGRGDTQLRSLCMTSGEHLLLLERRFALAEQRLKVILERESDFGSHARTIIIAHEFLGELYTETAQYAYAKQHLSQAYTSCEEATENDILAEVLRRRAQLDLCLGEVGSAQSLARRGLSLSMRIGDRYEFGACARVLGEIYVAKGDQLRAGSCFALAVRTLKSIHECYELMRALLNQGQANGGVAKRDEAEISLLEARQLAKKLELDYYQALIAIALVDVLTPQERWSEASTWLAEATALRDNLEGIDRERVEKALRQSANELQRAITRASVREAETLKTICRVYEDARFPIAEMKPDLAYQVAQSVGGECLFVVGRKGSGFSVPLTYNIAVNEAKDIVRHLDAAPKKPLLGIDSGPQVLTMQSARTLVAVPCYVTPNGTGKDRSAELYAFCTRFDGNVTVTPRQMELLYASSDALARLIEDEGERHAHATPEEQSRARHPRGSFKEILTIDADMIKLIKVAERAATSVAPILLEGETGVGKELFARAIHGASKRKDGPFVAVNAGGMSVSLLESELFGHVRGAFTDASSDRLGFIETARGGTLFLDEVGEMGEELQVKLLRLLENGEYRRLGESSVRKADVRVVSATNRDLKKEADRGNFRLDLYYRVAPLRLTIPPLRMRTSDIQLMVRHFLRDCAQMNGIADRYIEIDVKAMEALELYDWPGNVRELHNEILRVVSLIGRGDLVRFTMLSEGIQDYLQAKKRGTDGLLERSVEQYERRLILHALEKNDWNHLRTAEAIGVPRTTLLAKLKRLNIASK